MQSAFAKIFSSDMQDTALQYSVSEGYAPLRRWITAEMGKLGIPCDIDNICQSTLLIQLAKR